MHIQPSHFKCFYTPAFYIFPMPFAISSRVSCLPSSCSTKHIAETHIHLYRYPHVSSTTSCGWGKKNFPTRLFNNSKQNFQFIFKQKPIHIYVFHLLVICQKFPIVINRVLCCCSCSHAFNIFFWFFTPFLYSSFHSNGTKLYYKQICNFFSCRLGEFPHVLSSYMLVARSNHHPSEWMAIVWWKKH